MEPSMNKHYDLIVIGCGPGGYKSAIIAAQLGYSVAIIEKSHAGGTCLNQGCVPKEALTRIAKLVDDVKSFNGLGLDCTASPNFSDAVAHKNKLVETIGKTITPWLKQLGIHFIQGDASFLNENTVQVKTTKENISLIGDRIIIATGSKPKKHPTIPLRSPDIINSKEFMFEVKDLPRRVLFIGGGCISTELAFVLRQFGSRVTIVENSDQLLNNSNVTDRASSALEKRLKKIGIGIKKNTRAITEITTINSINVVFSDGSAEGFDLILIAIGRTANTDGLNLKNAGVDTDENGFVITDEYLQTSANGIYAIGDVKQGPMTANAAFHDAKVATKNALNGNQTKNSYHNVPVVIDSALQIANVGFTEDTAEDAGYDTEVIRTNLAGSTIGQLTHNVEGFIDIVHDDETREVLGGCVVGPEAREMIHTISAATQAEDGLRYFTNLHYAHPSWNEEFENIVSRHINEFEPREESPANSKKDTNKTKAPKLKTTVE